jgi:hypothetical protein
VPYLIAVLLAIQVMNSYIRVSSIFIFPDVGRPTRARVRGIRLRRQMLHVGSSGSECPMMGRRWVCGLNTNTRGAWSLI